MTAQVATASSAFTNIILLHLSELELIHFYLNLEEQKDLDLASTTPERRATAKKEMYDFKKKCAFDEFDRQFFPLVYFFIGCISSVPAVERYGFHCLWIAVGVILFLVFEIYLAKSDQIHCLFCATNKISNKDSDEDSDNEDDEKEKIYEDYEGKLKPSIIGRPISKDIDLPKEEHLEPSLVAQPTAEDIEMPKEDLKPSLSTRPTNMAPTDLQPRKPKSILRRTSLSGVPFYTRPRLSSRYQRSHYISYPIFTIK